MTATVGSKQCGCGRTISANRVQCRACGEAKPQVLRGSGALEILNVQGGDIKITFEKGDIAETIRARRIVTDMLRRGYALVPTDDVIAHLLLMRSDEHKYWAHANQHQAWAPESGL